MTEDNLTKDVQDISVMDEGSALHYVEEADSVLRWLNQSSKSPLSGANNKRSDSPATGSVSGSSVFNTFHKKPENSGIAEKDASSRLAMAKLKIAEWKQRQAALQNNVNIQVCTQNIDYDDSSTAAKNVETVKPWDNIPFSEKTKVTAIAQLGLRYMQNKARSKR